MSQPTENQAPHDPLQAFGPTPTLSDLPPVEAPSAGFIVQLFVIPAVVVAVVIVVWLLFGKLAGGERDAREYVRLLRSPEANWRAAFELASLIQNDARLASDPELLGELSDLLAHDLDKDDNPKLTQYVTLTLGAFRTIDARSASGRPVDPIAVLSRALEPSRPGPVRIAAAASLAKHAARLEGQLDDPRAVHALEEAGAGGGGEAEGDNELRQMAVYALGFFGGEPAAAILRERIHDPDRFVRYNAAIALGRRGDPSARGTLREMLSTTDLGKVLTFDSDLEKQNKIESIQLESLQALQASIAGGHPDLAASLRPEIDGLTRSGLASVRSQALALIRAGSGQAVKPVVDPRP